MRPASSRREMVVAWSRDGAVKMLKGVRFCDCVSLSFLICKMHTLRRE